MSAKGVLGPTRLLDPETLARLSNLKLAARLVVEGFIAGSHRSPYRGFSVEFAEHRHYLPGDDLKHLDWKVFAKTDRYYVKRYQEETNLRGYLVVDASASMGYSSDSVSKLRYSSLLAAALAYLMTRQQDAVGLVTFDTAIRYVLAPRTTRGHLEKILRHLCALRPAKGTNCGRALEAVCELTRRRGLVIVISDLLDEPNLVLRGLRRLRHRGHQVVVFHVLDPGELVIPFDGPVVLEDAETGEKIPVDPSAWRGEYRAAVSRFIEGYRLACRGQEIDYVLTDTSTPFDYLLRSYLSARKKMF